MMPDIRKFRAANTAGALAAVKASMGHDAVILSTRQIRSGILRQPEIEVVAALDSSIQNRNCSENNDDIGFQLTAPGNDSGRKFSARKNIEEEKKSKQSLVEQRGDCIASYRCEIAILSEALRSAREEIKRLKNAGDAERISEFPKPAARLYGVLTARGVDQVVAENILNEAMQETENSNTGLEKIAIGLMAKKMSYGEAPWKKTLKMESGMTRIIGLIGPSGVGKTTTAAKIAAKAIIESNLKVSFITIDDFRVGAKEQLGQYAGILNVRMDAARNEHELLRAISKNKSKDLIIIDTGGRADNQEQMRQARMLSSVDSVELHLVHSLVSGPEQLTDIVTRYRTFNPERTIFTKLDETNQPGIMLLPSLELSRRKLVCITDGQNVPDDIHSVDPLHLASMIIR